MCLRPSCGTCPYTSTQREADITLGDFWAIERFKPELNDDKGTSMILVHNEKGREIFNLIKNKFVVLERVPIEYAKYYNITLYTPLKQHINRKKFFRLLNSGKNLNYIIKNCNADKVDVAIFNLWPYQNYGGVLNAYALQKTIKRFGYSSKLINWQYPNWQEKYHGSFVEKFANKYLDITRPFYDCLDLFVNANSMADTFIAGSDCIWSTFWFKDFFNYLPFADSDKKKISYAPCFGNANYVCSDDLFLLNKYYLSLFDNISVREDSGCKILKEKFDLNAFQVLDPTLLLCETDYNELLNTREIQNNNYILNYCICNKANTDYIKHLLNNFENVISYNQFDSDKKSVAEWLALIKGSKLLFTNSYHACCFAIIFNVPFWILKPADTDFSRFESLFKLLGLDNRIIYNLDEIPEKNIFDPIDWKYVNIHLEKEKANSLNWLKNALETPKSISAVKPVDSIIHYLSYKNEYLNSQKLSIEDLFNVLNYNKNYIMYLLCRILKYFSFGKLRKTFRDKQKIYCGKVISVRDLKRKYYTTSY